MERKLLQICGYGEDVKALELASRIKNNYSDFEGIVNALVDLKPILDHSDFYLSLLSERDMIKIKNDMVDEEGFMMVDSEIIVWANEHNIELEEGLNQICLLGFKRKD